MPSDDETRPDPFDSSGSDPEIEDPYAGMTPAERLAAIDRREMARQMERMTRASERAATAFHELQRDHGSFREPMQELLDLTAELREVVLPLQEMSQVADYAPMRGPIASPARYPSQATVQASQSPQAGQEQPWTTDWRVLLVHGRHGGQARWIVAGLVVACLLLALLLLAGFDAMDYRRLRGSPEASPSLSLPVPSPSESG